MCTLAASLEGERSWESVFFSMSRLSASQ